MSSSRNFELPRVKSINASGHKYGLVTAGVGWIVWRDESFLPNHLIFELHYLGGTERSFTLNFSRPGAHVIVQYYNLVHLGFSGYREVMENCLANARLLSKSLEATGFFTCVSDIHRPVDKAKDGSAIPDTVSSLLPGASSAPATGETSADYVAGLPVVSFHLSPDFRASAPHVSQETISLLLRARGWIVPNYALPPNEDSTQILRVVVRESMGLDLMDRLVADCVEVARTLAETDQMLDLTRFGRGRGAGSSKDVKAGPEAPEAPQKGEYTQGALAEKSKAVAAVTKRMAEGIHRTVC